MKDRLPGLDGLRAISVALVLLIHSAHLPGFPKWSWLHRVAGAGGNGVMVFFVISGFLITWLLLREEARRGQISLRDFYFRRALRILPAAFAYLAGISILGLANAPEIVECVFFVRNLHPLTDNTHSLTGHFWTLSIEEQFYLIWPYALRTLQRRWRIPTTACLCLAAPFWRQLNAEWFGAGMVNWSRVDLRYEYLLFGALLALAQNEPRLRIRLDRLASHGTLGFSLSAGVLAFIWFSNWSRPGYIEVFVPTVVSLVIAYSLKLLIESRCPLINSAFNWPPVAWIGRLSYSLYLWHELFCFQSVWPSLQSWGMAMTLSILAATASYYLIEGPSLMLRARIQLAWSKRVQG